MKAFLVLPSLLALSSAAPGLLGVAHAPLLAGQVSHQSISKPFQGEHMSTTQSKAFGAGVAAVANAPNILHGPRGVVARPVIAHAPVLARPLALARPVTVAHAPVIAHAPVAVAHAAVADPDEPLPYTHTYAVNDDYSGSRFDAAETGNCAG